MPLYEYRCRTCRTTFELLRPMTRSTEPAMCPEGHASAERVVSLIAARARGGAEASFGPPAGGGCGSCAGGACACGGH